MVVYKLWALFVHHALKKMSIFGAPAYLVGNDSHRLCTIKGGGVISQFYLIAAMPE